MNPFHLTMLILALLLLAGCNGPPFGGSPPTIIETANYVPLADGLKFVGLCSVACSLIWGVSLITHANIKRKETNELSSETNSRRAQLLHSRDDRRSSRYGRGSRK